MRILLALVFAFCFSSAIAQKQSGSAPDPYVLSEHSDPTVGRGYRNTDGRTLANPTALGGTKRCNIVAFGQSNSMANYGQGAYTILNPTLIWNLNIYNGGLYTAGAPILGAGYPLSGGGESWGYRYADKLIAGTTCDRVVLVSAAISSTFVADWAVGGMMNSRILATAKRMTAAGMQASGIIFMQGESDTAGGTTQVNYASSLTSVIATIQAAFPSKPIFIPQTSYYLGTTSSPVRAAQLAATNGTTIFNVGDSDTIPAGNRWDNIHFDATGSNTWATTLNTNTAARLIVY